MTQQQSTRITAAQWKEWARCTENQEQAPCPGCPTVIYENEDGRCSHPAHEGRAQECGRIVDVISS